MMRVSLRLARVMGIPINIHISFLFILPFIAIAFGFTALPDLFGYHIGFGDLPAGDLEKLFFGLVAAILFFVSVLIHELAHSYVAVRNGYVISGITLFVFGGVSEIEKQPPQAPGEALMAFVGPAASFIIGLLLLPIWLALRNENGLAITVVAITTSMMSFYNILLAGFNIIPAFPMDGGRILRALLARRIGFMRATKVAVAVGKAIAVFMAMVGFFYSIWLILIAIFIYLGAREEERGTTISMALEGITVEALMTREVSTVPPTMTARQLLDKMLAEKHLGYPVMDGERLIGVITLEDIQRVPAEFQDVTLVERLMSRQIVSVSPTTPAFEAIQTISSRRIGRLMVMDGDRLVGIVSRSDLLRTLEIKAIERGTSTGRT